jgi:uncharacterized protein (DUF1015 family)
MASLHPFRALRPTPPAAATVSSVPYDVVSVDEARQLAAGNPVSFLHVTRSEIDLPPGTDPYAADVYELARQNLAALRAQAPLVVEDSPSVYFYRLRDDRTRHIVELRAQTGVVFLTYRGTPKVDAEVARGLTASPLYDFTAADGVQHTIWRAPADSAKTLVDAFARIPALYIADGHHRAASAARARAALQTQVGGGAADAETFIAVAFPHNQMQILPYNRTVKDLAGQTPDAFLDALRAKFPVAEGPATPRRKGEVSMYLAGRWYVIDLSAAAPADDSRASGLDVALLERHVLQDMLGIGDIRSDKRIDFVGGARGVTGLEGAVNGGASAVAFSMFPVTIDDLMAISDAGGIMPPKSTWFEPKLRDGLLVHLI